MPSYTRSSPRHFIPVLTLLCFFASTSVAWASGSWTGLLQVLAWVFVAAPAGVITIGLCIWMVVELKKDFDPSKNYARRAKWAWWIIVVLAVLAIISLQGETFIARYKRMHLLKYGLLFSIPNLGLAFIGYFLTSTVRRRSQEEAPSTEEVE